MKWMIRTGSTPAERARLRVVYAMARTVFYAFELVHHGRLFIIALGLGLYYCKNILN